MTVERFIARRYLFGKKKFSFINIISLLATLGILFGVAALIVVMSVFNGFNSLVVSILRDFDPHIKVERLPHEAGMSDGGVRRIINAVPGWSGTAAFASRKAMMMAKGANTFAWITGVDPARIDGVSGVRRKIVLGGFVEPGSDGIALGITLADRMRVLVGDTVTLVSPAGMEQILTQYVTPTMIRCPVVGIFESKNKIYDGSYAFVTLATAQRFFRLGDRVTGFELRLTDPSRSREVQRELSARIGPGWTVSTWEDLHKDLYSVMRIERWSAFVLLSVIVAVAVFNILASLTMLVLEKTRDIGILRAMGMTANGVQRVFLYEGLSVGILGVAAGLTIGLALAWAQKQFGLVSLDAAFIIPALPVEIRFSDVAIISGSAFALCLLAAWIPARRARAVEIIDAVRWE